MFCWRWQASLELRHIGLEIDVHGDEAPDLPQRGGKPGLVVEVGVADLPTAAPAEEVDLAEAAAGQTAGYAGDPQGHAEVAGVALDAPVGEEREVGSAGRHEGPAEVDAPDVDAPLGEEDRQGMIAGQEGGPEAPDVSMGEEDRFLGAGGHVGSGLLDHAVDADLVERTGAGADFEEVLGYLGGQDAPLDAGERIHRGRDGGRLGRRQGEGRQGQGSCE